MRVMRASLLLAVALVAWVYGSTLRVAAQDQPGNFDIRVYACTQNPVGGGLAADVPAGCETLVGVEVDVATLDGRHVASCTTGEGRPDWGQCSVLITVDERVVVTEDIATLPPGYAPRENPIVTRAYGEFSGAIFVNLPLELSGLRAAQASTVPQGAVAALPNTGSGNASDPANAAPLVAAIIALVAALALGRAASSSAPSTARTPAPACPPSKSPDRSALPARSPSAPPRFRPARY